MLIGVVSDIHGNVDGLIDALALMGDVDELLCLEDYTIDTDRRTTPALVGAGGIN